MEVTRTLGYPRYTKRITGRRAITPMRSKHKHHIKKTRGHKVEKRPYVPLLKHTSSQLIGERKEADEGQLGEHQKREGDQDCHDQGGKQDTQELTQVEQVRNTENSEKSVHPGPVQTVFDLPEGCADDTQAIETEIESEVLQ